MQVFSTWVMGLGQDWVIVCPARKESIEGLGGILESWLPYPQSYAELVTLLVLPSRHRHGKGRGLRPITDLKTINPNYKPELAQGSWAGQRIACVGSFSTDDLLRWKGPGSDLEAIDPQLSEMSFYDAEDSYSYPSFGDYPSYDEISKTVSKTGKKKRRILRNLDTKEYVRESKLPYGITLASVLLVRICCSSSSSTGVPGWDHLADGEWAGHRFDIVRSDLIDKSGWKDVSKGALEDSVRVWEALFGEDWPRQTYL